MLNKQMINQAFTLLKDGQIEIFFNDYVSEKVKWEITGSNEIAGVYKSKADLLKNGVGRIRKVLQPNWKLNIKDIFVDKENEVAVVEMLGEGKALNGESYHDDLCFVTHFKGEKIVDARVYYDDILINRTLLKNE